MRTYWPRSFGWTSLIWTRQRQANQLHSTLREFYPAALQAFDDLAGRDAFAVLAAASTPTAGRALSVEAIVALLRQAGRQRYLETTVLGVPTSVSVDWRHQRCGLALVAPSAEQLKVRYVVQPLVRLTYRRPLG
jgi:hypothetical protein